MEPMATPDVTDGVQASVEEVQQGWSDLGLRMRQLEADALAILRRPFDSHQATKITKDAQRPSGGIDREVLREPFVIVVAS